MRSVYTVMDETIYRDIKETGQLLSHSRCFEGVTQEQYDMELYRYEGGIYAVNRCGEKVVFCNRLK